MGFQDLMSILAATRCTAANARGLRTGSHWRVNQGLKKGKKPKTSDEERVAENCYQLVTKMAESAERIGWEGGGVCPHLSFEVCNYLERFDNQVFHMIDDGFRNRGDKTFVKDYLNGLAALSDRLVDYE